MAAGEGAGGEGKKVFVWEGRGEGKEEEDRGRRRRGRGRGEEEVGETTNSDRTLDFSLICFFHPFSTAEASTVPQSFRKFLLAVPILWETCESFSPVFQRFFLFRPKFLRLAINLFTVFFPAFFPLH